LVQNSGSTTKNKDICCHNSLSHWYNYTFK
jgi:hypothetical protein